MLSINGNDGNTGFASFMENAPKPECYWEREL